MNGWDFEVRVEGGIADYQRGKNNYKLKTNFLIIIQATVITLFYIILLLHSYYN